MKFELCGFMASFGIHTMMCTSLSPNYLEGGSSMEEHL